MQKQSGVRSFTPEEFAQWIRTEIVRWGKVIREANIGFQ